MMRSVQGSGDSLPHLPPLNGHCYNNNNYYYHYHYQYYYYYFSRRWIVREF